MEKEFKEEKWSLDACVGKAIKSGEFTRKEIVCSKTLYNYVDKGLMDIKNIDLPEKVRRSHKKRRIRENRKKLGDSIEERSKEIEKREEFGHSAITKLY